MIEELRRELRPMVRLAAPLAMAELGWMAMGFVGIGMLYGMDTEVAQSFGARDDAACRRTLIQGLWLAAIVGPIAAVSLWAMLPLLRVLDTNPRVMELLD